MRKPNHFTGPNDSAMKPCIPSPAANAHGRARFHANHTGASASKSNVAAWRKVHPAAGKALASTQETDVW